MKFYDLLKHCISATVVPKSLTFKLLMKIDDALKPEVVKWAAFSEQRLVTCGHRSDFPFVGARSQGFEDIKVVRKISSVFRILTTDDLTMYICIVT